MKLYPDKFIDALCLKIALDIEGNKQLDEYLELVGIKNQPPSEGKE